jgi:hypothetical protein
MTCRELLQQFVQGLDNDEVDEETFKKLVSKCGPSFGLEALKALARRAIHFAMSKAWAYYRGAVIAERDPAAAYGQAVYYIWQLSDWLNIPCYVLADIATYVAEAAARYKWPARWPFVVPAAVAAEENNCELPDAVAEHLGPDEYSKLEAFLEQGEAVAEVAPRLKVALIRDGKYVMLVI